MDTNRLLSALAYFSIFFAPFLLPVILYFISPDREVKDHSKKALLSHLLPVVAIPLLFAVFASSPSAGMAILAFLIFGGLSLLVFIYNVVQGIRVLIR